MGVAVIAPHFLGIPKLVRIPVANFRADLAGVLGRVKQADPADPALARDQAAPKALDVVTNGRNRAQASDDYPAIGIGNRNDLGLPRLGLDVVDHLADGLELLGVGFRDLALDLVLELFFERHDQLDGVE